MTPCFDTTSGFRDPLVQKIVSFIRLAGIEVNASVIEGQTFVPGIQIRHGAIHADEEKMTWPGDLLHEAGHLAVVEANERKRVHIDTGNDPANEMAAIAWSYAAGVELKLDPAVIFHADGYKGESDALIENFTSGRYIGVPMLQYYGLCEGNAYPVMLRWLR